MSIQSNLKQCKAYLLVLMSFFLSWNLSSQIKVGNNPKIINSNSILEMEHTSKGMLLPRLALTSTNSFAPMTAHVQGMVVYNTATAGDVSPGYYYNDGAKWVRVFGQSAAGDLTNANGIIVTNGTGAVLTSANLRLDSTAIAKFIGQSPVKDSIAKVVISSPVKDSIVKTMTSGSGRDSIIRMMTSSPTKDSIYSTILSQSKTMKAGSKLVTINNTDSVQKSVLTTVSVDINSSVLKDSTAKWIGLSPIKDSLTKNISTTVTQSPVKDSILSMMNANGNDLTGTGIIVIGGIKTTLKATSMRLDSSSIAKFVGQSPVKDSIAKLVTSSPVKDSIASFEPWYSTLTNKGATKNTDSVYILGKVGIGTSTPSERLEVSGNIYCTGQLFQNSDVRLKTAITTVGNALNKVKAIKGVEWLWNSMSPIQSLDIHTGVLAQDIEAVMPHLVKEHNGIKSVNYDGLTAYLIESIKELSVKIEAQEKELRVLKSRTNKNKGAKK